MPHKRQTKKVRNVPELPDGDEGKDLTKEQQQAKLQVFLNDFDRKFDEKIKEIDDKINFTLKKIDTYCHIGLQQIPKALQKMKLQDFIAGGGTFEMALQCIAKKENVVDKNAVNSLNSIACGGKALNNQLYNDPTFQKIAADCATSLQMLDMHETQSTLKKTKPSALRENNFVPFKKPLLENQVMTDDIDMSVERTLRQSHPRRAKATKQGTSSIKTRSSKQLISNEKYQTPSMNWPSKFLMTPAITPKFDPRLPMTPFDRQPRQNERLMSLAGSPVSAEFSSKMDKIKERISMALMNEAFEGNVNINVLNEVLEVIKE